jgi:hypothetical protein
MSLTPHIDAQKMEIQGEGGSLGFWPNSLEGVSLRLSENLGVSPFSCFIAFLCDNFSDLTPSPPL